MAQQAADETECLRAPTGVNGNDRAVFVVGTLLAPIHVYWFYQGRVSLHREYVVSAGAP